jgi:hypothetical protein
MPGSDNHLVEIHHSFLNNMDLQTDALVDTIALPATSEKAAALNDVSISTSRNVTGLEVRLSQVHIKNNRNNFLFLHGRADIYLMLLVVDNLGAEPKALTINTFPDVGDNEDLPITDAVYDWQSSEAQTVAPNQIHIMLSVLKSKKTLRDAGDALVAAKNSAEYKSTLTQLIEAVAKAPAQVADLALSLGGIVGGFLSDVEDKPLFTQVVSFTDIYGDFDALGKTEHTQENDFVSTDLTLVVRDVQRQQEPTAPLG